MSYQSRYRHHTRLSCRSRWSQDHGTVVWKSSTFHDSTNITNYLAVACEVLARHKHDCMTVDAINKSSLYVNNTSFYSGCQTVQMIDAAAMLPMKVSWFYVCVCTWLAALSRVLYAQNQQLKPTVTRHTQFKWRMTERCIFIIKLGRRCCGNQRQRHGVCSLLLGCTTKHMTQCDSRLIDSSDVVKWSSRGGGMSQSNANTKYSCVVSLSNDAGYTNSPTLCLYHDSSRDLCRTLDTSGFSGKW